MFCREEKRLEGEELGARGINGQDDEEGQEEVGSQLDHGELWGLYVAHGYQWKGIPIVKWSSDVRTWLSCVLFFLKN